MTGAGPVPREEPARGWRTQVEKGSGRRFSWTPTEAVVADILVFLCVSCLTAEVRVTGLVGASE